MIDLNENLESLLAKAGPKVVSKPFVFMWRSKETQIHITELVRSLEVDWINFYHDRLDWQKYRSLLGTGNYATTIFRIDGYHWNVIGKYIEEAMLNSSTHGYGIAKNKRIRKPIRRSLSVQVYYGRKGVIYSIKDPGTGFNVDEIVRKMATKEGHGQKFVNSRGIEFPGGQGFCMFDCQSGPEGTLVVSFNYNGKSPPVGVQRQGNEGYGSKILLCYLFRPEFTQSLR